MRHTLLALLLTVSALCPAIAEEYKGKAIYIPKELSENDFNSPDSKWSYSRMACTENIALFWAPGFGNNISAAPDLDGHNMKVDLANLLARLEQFYHVFYTDMQFVKPGTKADKYRMMVMLDYSLEGTAYGGDYDQQIGALWIAPNRVQDSSLNCIAHELGHSFQSQISCDGEGEAWGGCGFFEMASQWMLWQVNPDWQTDENYHLQAFRNLTHKAFLHIDNIYHSPYILEYWSEKHGLPIIADLFRNGKIGEDPAMTYMRITGINQEQFNDEMFDAERRMINWDYPRVADHNRKYAGDWATKLTSLGNNRWLITPENCPENYGFNAIQLTVPAPGTKVSVEFTGEAGLKGFNAVNIDKAGWRYGFVAINADGSVSYSEAKSGKKGKLAYTVPADAELKQLWLVVMGAPTEHWRNIDGPENPGDAQWPYSIKLHNTTVKN
jgi:hypothetical protein